MNLAVNFGKKLKQIRKEKGLTQEQLAQMIDIEPMSISRIECGARFPERENIEKIIIALKCKAKDLFDFEENNLEKYKNEEIKNLEYYKKQIGKNIAKYRKIKELSQKQLAIAIQISPQTLSCIETGINNPSFNAIIKIAQVLNIPIAYLFTFDEKIYNINSKELLFLASQAFKDLNYEDRKLAFELIKCFKKEKGLN